MTEHDRKLALAEFIEAMAEYLGKEDTRDILVEVGRDEKNRADAAGRVRAGACGDGAAR
jgi:hypothetical protein